MGAFQALVDAEVEFVLIGGWAAIVHGSAHVTGDLDLCLSSSPSNLERVASALAPFSPNPPRVPAGQAECKLTTTLGELHLFREVAGVGDFRAVKTSSIAVEAFDREIQTLGLPGLIASKRGTGRVSDILVLPELESLLEAAGETPGD